MNCGAMSCGGMNCSPDRSIAESAEVALPCPNGGYPGNFVIGGQHFQEMSVRVSEIDAASAIMVVYVHVFRAGRPAAILDVSACNRLNISSKSWSVTLKA